MGKENYWDFLLQTDVLNAHRFLQITSIGGAQGYDAVAIDNVFKESGFNTNTPIVVDPNPMAAYLSQETNVDYYLNTGQEFFENNFKRDPRLSYIFHLGTTLNILSVEQATELLEVIAEKMSNNDALSLITVHEKQFMEMKSTLEKGKLINKAGFVSYSYFKSKKVYKTVIGDEIKFSHFMKEIGLEGKTREFRNEKGRPVIFSIYRSIKQK